MTDYEKASPSWDIGIVLTRHYTECARVQELVRTAAMNGNKPSAERRLSLALMVPCTCGMGDSTAETTSVHVTIIPEAKRRLPNGENSKNESAIAFSD